MNIITVFAGRKPNLAILMKYLRQALSLGIIHEVHLWNYTRNNADDAYVKELADEESHIYCMPVLNKKTWGEYYANYNDSKYEDDIIIKCDDDIVFIDLVKLPAFIQYVRENEDITITTANIINNGVIAHYQQNKHNLVPKELIYLEYPREGLCGSLWESGHKATMLHRHFMANYSNFLNYDYSNDPTIRIYGRFSINFFGIRGAAWHNIADCCNYGESDERAITVDLPGKRKYKVMLYFDCYVSHLSFYRQMETKIEYSKLVEEYNAFYDIVNDSRFIGKPMAISAQSAPDPIPPSL